MSKKPKITTREVSIIYRREVGNIKHPNFAMDSACVSWLVINHQDNIGSPAELSSLVEGHSGIKTTDLEDQSSAEAANDIINETNTQINTKISAIDNSKNNVNNNDISDWLVDKINGSNR